MRNLNHTLLSLTLTFIFSIPALTAQDSLIIYARENGLDSMLAYQLATQVPNVAYSEPERGREQAKEALELAQNLNSYYLMGSAYNGWGIYYDIAGKLDSAIVAYTKAIENLKKYQGKQKGVLGSPYNNLGLIYHQIGDLKKALQNYLLAKEQFEESGIAVYTANALGNIALIYQDQEDYDEALKIQRKVLEIRKNTDDGYGITASYVNIADLYNLTGKNQDSSLYYYRKAIQWKEALPDYRGLAIIYNNLAAMAYPHHLKEAESHYLKALGFLRKIDDNSLSIGNYRGLARVYAQLGRLEKAQLYIDSAITFATNIEADQELAKNYNVQITIDSLSQDEPALLQHWPLAYYWNNKVQRENFSEELAMARSRFETAQREEELLQSRAQLAETAAEVARKEVRLKSRQNWIIGLAALLLLVLIAVFFFRRQQKLKEKQLTAEADLREAQAREEAQKNLDKERKRIGRELHDNVGGKIYTIVNSLDYLGLKHQELQEKGELDKLSEQARVVMADLRETIWVMSEEVISVDDISEKLKEFMAKYETVYAGSCQVNVSGNGRQQVGPEKALAVFRVCQEAFQNAVKHAACDHFSIQITVAEDGLQLRIEDDGKGFDAGLERSGSYGLKNMKERVTENHGEFKLDSEPGKGTVIEMGLPLKGLRPVERSA
ncbi:MAG TPA: hypothetical protein DDW81_01445 [Cryomorphaceae bacterium]|nr:hypothetical protein [Owenweeksia sp.]HBF18727.1 hypothetical protein [Cryomorphaceae bacterium]|tara:strand:+ start:12180 stop:14174 length:1995 start_codon:yes stop_codon:yes gene_type:complete